MAGQDSIAAPGRSWWQAYGERRFGILLVLLTVLLAGPPVLFGFGLSIVWFDTLVGLVVLVLGLVFAGFSVVVVVLEVWVAWLS